MAKLIVVQNDDVKGTDTHNVSGTATVPGTPPTMAFAGTGRYAYIGKMTTVLSNFVSINGTPIAIQSSQSSLNPGESAPPNGKHSGPQGADFVPPSVPGTFEIQKDTVSITDTVGIGNPSETAGSTFVTVGGVAIVLDGDSIDTCDGTGATGNSTVKAANQDFVFCSA